MIAQARRQAFLNAITAEDSALGKARDSAWKTSDEAVAAETKGHDERIGATIKACKEALAKAEKGFDEAVAAAVRAFNMISVEEE